MDVAEILIHTLIESYACHKSHVTFVYRFNSCKYIMVCNPGHFLPNSATSSLSEEKKFSGRAVR